MNRLACVLLATLTYVACAHSTSYSCDVFNEKQKIKTLIGVLNNSDPSGRLTSIQQIDPDTALALTLCPLAGLKSVNMMMPVSNIRPSSRIMQNQTLTNPACILKCTQLSAR